MPDDLKLFEGGSLIQFLCASIVPDVPMPLNSLLQQKHRIQIGSILTTSMCFLYTYASVLFQE